jgi:hypothetical protein
LKVLPDFCRNLVIRHLVNSLHTHDASTEVGFLQTLFQFTLGLPGAENQHEFGITNRRDDRITVSVKMGRKCPLPSPGAELLVFRFPP